MRYIELLTMQFLNIMHRNFYTTSLFIARDIVKGEDRPTKAILDKLEYIRMSTCEELDVPLSTVEAYYISNWIHLSKSVELRTNSGDIIELPVYKLKFYLDKAYIELRDIVRTVAIKYSIDIPFKGTEGSTIDIG